MTNLATKEERPVRVSLDLVARTIRVNDDQILLSQITDLSMVRTNRLLYTYQDGYFEIRTDTGVLRPYLLAWQEIKKEVE